MNHYVYQITNNINGKIYIGKRSCKCDIKDDKYFGSGYYLKSAIKKYGIENFTKTIIDICSSSEQAYELEAALVDKDFIHRQDTYNICGGGIGPSCHSDESKLKMSANNGMKGKTSELCPNFGKTHSEKTKAKMSINHVGMKGKHHSEESRAKISANHGMKDKKLSPETIAKRNETRKINKLTKQSNIINHKNSIF